MLGEILVYSWICRFSLPSLYKGFIIDNFNLSVKNPLVRTLLYIQIMGELMNGGLIFNS